jgi:hypothetical protein
MNTIPPLKHEENPGNLLRKEKPEILKQDGIGNQ